MGLLFLSMARLKIFGPSSSASLHRPKWRCAISYPIFVVSRSAVVIPMILYAKCSQNQRLYDGRKERSAPHIEAWGNDEPRMGGIKALTAVSFFDLRALED